MCRCREKRKHPDDEEMVRHHGLHFCQTDALDSDTRYDLLIGEGEEEFSDNFCFGFAHFVEDDYGAEE